MKKIYLLALITFFISYSCQPTATKVVEKDYPTAIIGHWQESPGDYYKEYIRFDKDESFVSQLRSGGFIGNTISQGIDGNATGNWKIENNRLTLNITKADAEELLNKAGTYTIISFTTNEIKLEDSHGKTSTFVRLHGM